MSFSEWKEVKLGDIIEISSSKRIYAKEYIDNGIPFYRSKEIIEKSKGNDIKTELYISTERFEELKTKFGAPIKGDILLTSVGTLGIPYIVGDEEFYFKDGNLTWMKNFKDECYNKYIYYWLISDFGKNQINAKCIGSTQKALTIETLKKFELVIPSLPQQKAIAHILSTLDEKIEVNNKINKTLENMAQSIFKEWFVDFEFPNEDGELYKSSGGEMIESELGMIPKGWEVGNFSEFVSVKYGKDHKKLSDGGIPVYGSGGVMRYVDKALYSLESVLIPRKGTLNNIIYVNKPFWSVDTMFFTEMKLPYIAKYIYFFMKSKDLVSMNVGSAVPSMTTDILNNMKIAMPTLELMKQYDEIISKLFNNMSVNTQENTVLGLIRDSLLPKLMSGEIRVPF